MKTLNSLFFFFPYISTFIILPLLIPINELISPNAPGLCGKSIIKLLYNSFQHF